MVTKNKKNNGLGNKRPSSPGKQSRREFLATNLGKALVVGGVIAYGKDALAGHHTNTAIHNNGQVHTNKSFLRIHTNEAMVHVNTKTHENGETHINYADHTNEGNHSNTTTHSNSAPDDCHSNTTVHSNQIQSHTNSAQHHNW